MAEWREWRYGGKNGRMAEWQKWLHMYYLRQTHTDEDDNDNTDDDTLIYYSIDQIAAFTADKWASLLYSSNCLAKTHMSLCQMGVRH